MAVRSKHVGKWGRFPQSLIHFYPGGGGGGGREGGVVLLDKVLYGEALPGSQTT